MKKIKNIVLILMTFVIINGCNVLIVPTLVTKDVSLGVIFVNNLQDEDVYTQDITLDLSSLVSQDELDAIKEIKLKEVAITLNSDYENEITGSKSIDGAIIFYLPNVTPNGIDFLFNDALVAALGTFQPGVPMKQISLKENQNVKDLIVDGKIKMKVRINTALGWGNFKDNSFSYVASVKTEVLLEEED